MRSQSASTSVAELSATTAPTTGVPTGAPTAGAAATGVSFARDLAAHGDRAALLTPDGTVVSYRQLAARVGAVRSAFGSQRRLVLVEGANDIDPIVTYLAALAGGHPVLLAAPGGTAADDLVRRFDPDVVHRSGTGPVERRGGTRHELHPDLALLLSTSGSTGSAKLVRLSRANLESNAAAIADFLGIDRTERAITSLPMHYCYGLSVLHSHLLRGASVVLTDASVVDPCFWAAVREHSVTSFAGVPHTFDLLDRVGFDRMDVPSLRYLTQAGGRMAAEKVRRHAALARRNGRRLVVMYGQTEATARMAYLPTELAESHPGSIGVAIPGGSLSVDALPGEAHGELVYRGPNVMLGYADGPEDLASGRTIEELRTGDVARRTDDGLFEIVGRASRFVKPFGVRVDLDGLEAMLRDEGIDAVCTGTDRRIVAAIERDGGVQVDPPLERARRVLLERLGLPAGCVSVLSFDQIPRLPSGKPDHVAIRAAAEHAPTAATVDTTPAGAHGGDHPGDHPGGPDGGRISAVFAELLGVGTVAASDSFVGLGGDSLSYVEASLRIEAQLGYVPDGWHLLPAGELDALPPRRRATRALGRWRHMETNVVLRALAIVLVVCTHSRLFRQQGGAHLLFALAGFNFARFQLGEMSAGTDGVRRQAASIARIAVPTLAFSALASATGEGFTMFNLLLVHNYTGGGRWWYWYVEALLQLLVVLAVAFSIPAVRRAERARPFLFAMSALVPVLALRAGVVRLPVAPDGVELTEALIATHVIAWLFVIGWAAQRAGTVAQRAVVSVVLVLAMPGFFDNTSRELIVATGILLAMWVPRVVVPPFAHRVVGTIAGASLYVYLTHFFAYPDVREAHGPLAAVAVSLLLGIVVWVAVERVRRAVAAVRTRTGRPAARAARFTGISTA